MKFSNVSVYNIENAIRGMRNPLMSHAKSDTTAGHYWHIDGDDGHGSWIPDLGPNDYDLARRLIIAGEPHRKFLRQIFVSADITAPMFWMLELDTYKIGTTMDCSSTMHKLTSRDLTEDDFDPCETTDGNLSLGYTISALNRLRKEYASSNNGDCRQLSELYFRDMKRILPSSYNYMFTWTANYEVLANIYKWRHNHRLPHWHTFCDELIKKLPYSEFITGEFKQS